MPTGYEVQMYHHIERIAKATERQATALERIANVLEGATLEQGSDPIPFEVRVTSEERGQ